MHKASELLIAHKGLLDSEAFWGPVSKLLLTSTKIDLSAHF